MPPLTLHFPDTPTAEKALHLAGFSIGNQQHGAPRGVMFGTHQIGKWKTLTVTHKASFHAVLSGVSYVTEPVTVTLYEHAPACARDALMKEVG